MFNTNDKLEVLPSPSKRMGVVQIKVGESTVCLKADEAMKMAFDKVR